MISIVLYGRNDNYGYNLHKRAALSLNCMAELLTARTDELIFVDYNTPDDFPTFPEAIQDTLTDRAKRFLRILRVRPSVHARYADRTHLQALEPIARNVAVRRSNPRNRWILSTNTDMIFVPLRGRSLTAIASRAPDAFYHLPRFEIPESLWETLDRRDPAQVIRLLKQWGQSFHLNEIVTMNEVIRFDGPGDFQMILRDDLFRIHSFDERMLVGWHVDSNIAKRLSLLRGNVRDLTDDLYGYHCDHTRQVTPAHRPGGIQNDIRTFYEDVQLAELEHQAELWGLSNEPVEEVRLNRRGGFAKLFRKQDDTYVAALRAAIDGPMRKPTTIAYVSESYDQISYDANHVIPFLADALVCYPRHTHLGWFGCRGDLLIGFAKAWHAMGFLHPILVDRGPDLLKELPPHASFATSDDIASRADAFVFDFGLPARTAPDSPVLAETQRALTHVARGLRMIARAELVRLESPSASPRRLIAINAVNNQFEQLVRSFIGAAMAPMSTRMRQGFAVKPGETMELLPAFTIGAAGMRQVDRVSSIPGIPGYITHGPGLDLEARDYCFRLRFQVADLAAACARRSGSLRLEIFSAPFLIGYYLLTPADLMRGEIAVPFSVTQELADIAATLAVEFRFMTDGRISLSLVNAILEQLPTPLTLSPDEFDWLPLMSIGDAGELSDPTKRQAMPGVPEQSIGVRSQADGYVVFGPYCDLLPGRYELAIGFDMPETAGVDSSQHNGVVVMEVMSDGRFSVAQRSILGGDLRSGVQRIEFVVPRPVAGWSKTRQLEFRVRVQGEVSFTIDAIRTRRLPGDIGVPPELEWLPVMSIGDAGEYSDPTQGPTISAIAGSISVQTKAEGFVVFGPHCNLLPGRYELTIGVKAPHTDGIKRLEHNDMVMIDVIAQGRFTLAQQAVSRRNLTGPQRLEFTIPESAAEGRDETGLEFRVRVLGEVPLIIESIRTRRLSDETALSAELEWLPLMSVGPAGQRFTSQEVAAIAASATDAAMPEPEAEFLPFLPIGSSGMCVRSTGAGYLIFGPYCDLWPGRYQLTVEFLAVTDTPDGALPDDAVAGIVVVDVIAQTHLTLAELSISHENLVAGTQCLDFLVPSEFGTAKDAAQIEFRVRIEGRVRMAIGSVRTARYADESQAVESAILPTCGATPAARRRYWYFRP